MLCNLELDIIQSGVSYFISLCSLNKPVCMEQFFYPNFFYSFPNFFPEFTAELLRAKNVALHIWSIEPKEFRTKP